MTLEAADGSSSSSTADSYLWGEEESIMGGNILIQIFIQI